MKTRGYLTMFATEPPVFKSRKLLEKEIESKRRNLETFEKYIVPKDDECIKVLEAMKTKKEMELKNCLWIQAWSKSDLQYEISKLEIRIEELKSLEVLKNEIQELVQQLHDMPGQVWGEYPAILDDKIVFEYRSKFETLPFPLTQKIPFINIVMIGETGSGKSSLLRTFTTAVTNSTDIKDTYRVSPGQSKEKSVTKQVHFEPVYMFDDGPKLPCRFYDMPGIDKDKTIKKEDLEKIISGERKTFLEERKNTDLVYERQHEKQTPADEAHCILYVISSKTNLRDMPESLKLMTDIYQKNNTEDGVKQFVVVTFIDQLGVPNDNMKNAYQYPCVRGYCEKVSEAFGIDLLHVIPVSNYYEEVAPNDAKNAMSLFNLWRVFNSGKQYIERRWIRQETRFLSNDLMCKMNA